MRENSHQLANYSSVLQEGMLTTSLVYQEAYVPLAKIRKIRQGCLAKLEGVLLQTTGHWLFKAPCYHRGVLQLNIPFQRSGDSASSWLECGVAVSFFSHQIQPRLCGDGRARTKNRVKTLPSLSVISIDVFFSGTRGNIGKSDRGNLNLISFKVSWEP